MSIYYTNVTDRADYEWTVLSSTPVAAHSTLFNVGLGGRPPFRRVELDDRENGYYREYQLGRYRSFGCLVLSEEQWEKEIKDGYIILGEWPDADGRD